MVCGSSTIIARRVFSRAFFRAGTVRCATSSSVRGATALDSTDGTNSSTGRPGTKRSAPRAWIPSGTRIATSIPLGLFRGTWSTRASTASGWRSSCEGPWKRERCRFVVRRIATAARHSPETASRALSPRRRAVDSRVTFRCCRLRSRPGPGEPVGRESAPRLPVESSVADEAEQAARGERPVYRYRARYSKSGDLRFIGHLDLARLILRGLRRSGLELVYSRGFNPKPKVGFGPALAVGIPSEAEYVDFDTYRRLGQDDAESGINRALPDGLRFDLVKEIPRSAAALGEAIRAARYRVTSRGGGDLAETVDAFRARMPIEVRRQKKNRKTQSFDLSAELLSVEATELESLSMTLAMHHDGASVRPDEVLREIFGEPAPALELVREELLVDWKGRLVNPILAASASSPGS